VLLGAVRTYTHGGSGDAVAVRSSLPGGGTDYVFNDAHGTAQLAMDTTTQQVARQQYTPYGQQRAGANGTAWPDPTHSYLGKPQDTATGYTDVGARKYDPALGRFISADPKFEATDPQELGGYTYAGDNPVTNADPTGMMIYMLGGGGKPVLTDQIEADGRRAIYDAYGIGHLVGGDGDNDAARMALKVLNADLAAAGVYSDGSGHGTGEQYLPQIDKDPLVKKGSFTDSKGNLRFNGTTSDMIRVSYVNGKIVDVEDFDATSSKAGKALHYIIGDITGKMDPARKEQANNVVYVAQSAEQAQQVADHFAGNPSVRVIHPDSGFDTGRVFNGVTGGANLERVSPELDLPGRIFGIAGALMPFAQANSYIRSFGVWGGIKEMGENFIDPFGFHKMEEPSGPSNICDPSSGNCA